MDLKAAVLTHATEVYADAFDPLIFFYGKINPFAEVANSGATSQRRILETAPDVTIPSQRIIKDEEGEPFIIAENNSDFWNREVIRHKYPILPVVDVVGVVGTVGETLAALQPHTDVYAFPYFVRREMDEGERSDYFSGYEIYFSNVKSFTRGDILTLGTTYYRLKTDSWVDGAGFSVAQCVKLGGGAVRTFDILSQQTEYDPTTDSHEPVALIGITCFVEPLKQNYEFVTPSFSEVKPGDTAISVLKLSAIVKTGDFFDNYRVLSVRDKGDWVTCQCRNMGTSV